MPMPTGNWENPHFMDTAISMLAKCRLVSFPDHNCCVNNSSLGTRMYKVQQENFYQIGNTVIEWSFPATVLLD